MNAPTRLVGLMAISIVIIPGPAYAKTEIENARISGPGLGREIRIDASETHGLWESGIDVVGGLDDARSDSVEDLGLTVLDLGPRYVVAYRFFGDHLVRQELYPYAKGGPVTYTPPGQKVTAGVEMPITSGWHHGSRGFFRYLVEHGLPETNPVAASQRSVPDTALQSRTVPWPPIGTLIVGMAILSLAALAVRRVLAVGRAEH